MGIFEDIFRSFGVGFYSAFMVSDEITVYTRSAGAEAPGYCWYAAHPQPQTTGSPQPQPSSAAQAVPPPLPLPGRRRRRPCPAAAAGPLQPNL